MVVANTPEKLERIRILKSHGCKIKYYHETLGTNSRLDTIQAAALRVKLKYLDGWNNERRRVANRYMKNLDGHIQISRETDGCRHVYHQFTIRVPNRDTFKQELQDQGVGSMIYYPVSLHQQEAFRHLAYDEKDFPVTRKVQEEVLSLPMFPELKDEQIDEISKKVKSVLASHSVST